MSNKTKSGQVLLLVLLAMAALATMVLSVVSRSVSEVSVTSREEESLRAFSAAEAGVEDALINVQIGGSQVKDLTVPAPDSGNTIVSSYNASVERYPEVPTEYAYPFELLSGEAATVWFVTRDSSGTVDCGAGPCFNSSFDLCWGKQGVGGTQPAVFANIIYYTGSEYTIVPVGFDRDSGRALSNKFSGAGSGCTVAGQDYLFRASGVDLASLGSGLPAGSRPILMRVAMLYNENPHIFGVSTTNPLPTQGKKVSSEGSAGDVTRKIDAFLLNPEMPFIFDAAVYSEGSITK